MSRTLRARTARATALRIAGLLVVVALAACSSTPRAVSQALSGNWQPVAAQLGGNEVAIENFHGATLKLAGDAYDFGGDVGRFVVLPDTSPAAMDLQGREGPNAGRTIKAIYEATADTLVICYQLGPGERPTTFASPGRSLLFLVRYRRVP